jgi:hypothetical protein
MKMCSLAGVDCVDALECVREQVRIAGGAPSGKLGCTMEEEVDELRARRRGKICCDG